MDSLSEKLFDFLYNIPKRLYLPIAIGLIGIVFLIIGLIQLVYPSTKQQSTPLVQNASPQTSQKSPTAPTSLFGMQVDVEGAVVNPGVYKLPQNARVQDALIAAGGLSAAADREVVAKSVNLAAKLSDGVKIYVPKIGETVAQGAIGQADSQGTVLGAQTGLININSATADQLDSLSGVGPVTAQKIINGRPYSSVDDLLAKKVVSKSVFDKIKALITIY